jgi:stage V sporulation protein S
MTVLKVSKASNPHAVAGAIAGLVRDTGRAVMQAIGAAATNQAVKAIAIARSFMRDEGIDLMTRITFLDVEFGGETRTALRFDIADHAAFPPAEPQPERTSRPRPRPEAVAEPQPASLEAAPETDDGAVTDPHAVQEEV